MSKDTYDYRIRFKALHKNRKPIASPKEMTVKDCRSPLHARRKFWSELSTSGYVGATQLVDIDAITIISVESIRGTFKPGSASSIGEQDEGA